MKFRDKLKDKVQQGIKKLKEKKDTPTTPSSQEKKIETGQEKEQKTRMSLGNRKSLLRSASTLIPIPSKSKWKKENISTEFRAVQMANMSNFSTKEIATNKILEADKRFEDYIQSLKSPITSYEKVSKRDNWQDWVRKGITQEVFLESRIKDNPNNDRAYSNVARSSTVGIIQASSTINEDIEKQLFYDQSGVKLFLQKLRSREFPSFLRSQVVDVCKIHELMAIATAIAAIDPNETSLLNPLHLFHIAVGSKENFYDPTLYEFIAETFRTFAEEHRRNDKNLLKIADYIETIANDLAKKIKTQKKQDTKHRKWVESESQGPEPMEKGFHNEEYLKLDKFVKDIESNGGAIPVGLTTTLLSKESTFGFSGFRQGKGLVSEIIGQKEGSPLLTKVIEYLDLLDLSKKPSTSDKKEEFQLMSSPSRLTSSPSERKYTTRFTPERRLEATAFLNKLLGVSETSEGAQTILYNRNLQTELLGLVTDYLESLITTEPLDHEPNFVNLRTTKLDPHSQSKRDSEEKKEGEEKKERKISREELEKPDQKDLKKQIEAMRKSADDSIKMQDSKKIAETKKRFDEFTKNLKSNNTDKKTKEVITQIIHKDDDFKSWERQGVTQMVFLDSNKIETGGKNGWAYEKTARSRDGGLNTVINLQSEVNEVINPDHLFCKAEQAAGLALGAEELNSRTVDRERSIAVCKIHDLITALIVNPNCDSKLSQYLQDVLFTAVRSPKDFFNTALYSDVARFLRDTVRMENLNGEKRETMLSFAEGISILNQQLAKNLERTVDKNGKAKNSEKFQDYTALNMKIAHHGLNQDLCQQLVATNPYLAKFKTSPDFVEELMKWNNNQIVITVGKLFGKHPSIEEMFMPKTEEEQKKRGLNQNNTKDFLNMLLTDSSKIPPNNLLLFNSNKINQIGNLIVTYIDELSKSTADDLLQSISWANLENHINKNINPQYGLDTKNNPPPSPNPLPAGKSSDSPVKSNSPDGKGQS